MRITIQHILELIDVLPKGEPFDYVKPGDNKVVLVNVDFVNREISAKRISSNGDEQYVKFIEPNLKLLKVGLRIISHFQWINYLTMEATHVQL